MRLVKGRRRSSLTSSRLPSSTATSRSKRAPNTSVEFIVVGAVAISFASVQIRSNLILSNRIQSTSTPVFQRWCSIPTPSPDNRERKNGPLRRDLPRRRITLPDPGERRGQEAEGLRWRAGRVRVDGVGAVYL